MRASDAILAALQATFALPNLIDGANPYRFIDSDPAKSTVWICDPESRNEFGRAGSRALILVDRMDYSPANMHLLGNAGGDFDQTTEFSDLGVTNVVVTCEGGSRYQSEQLAAIVYQIVKIFRQELMREYDLHTIKPLSVNKPMQLEQAQGAPWLTTVMIRVEAQERSTLTELANQLNAVKISQVYNTNLERRELASFTLDAG